MNKIEIKIINKTIKKKYALPTYATSGSSGLDLKACIKNTIILESKQTVLIPTGIAIYIKDPNISALILPRSGIGHKNGIVLGNLVGLIDSDYQGELMVSLWNRGKEKFSVKPHARIAQIIFIPIIKPYFSLVEEFDKTLRSEKGFGHSGV